MSQMQDYALANRNQENKMRAFVESMRQNQDVLRQISDFNENLRRRCQHELQSSNSINDAFKNQIFEYEQSKQLYMVKYQVLEEQFTLLYNSIETISNAKNIQDKFEQELELFKQHLEKQSQENSVLSKYVKETTAERDYYRKNTQTLLDKKMQLEKEKALQMDTFKKKLFELDRDIKAKTEECNDNFD